jgi:hypothetical protein
MDVNPYESPKEASEPHKGMAADNQVLKEVVIVYAVAIVVMGAIFLLSTAMGE